MILATMSSAKKWGLAYASGSYRSITVAALILFALIAQLCQTPIKIGG